MMGQTYRNRDSRHLQHQAMRIARRQGSLFIPDNGSRIAAEARANGISHGIGEPSILKVVRNLESNSFRDANGKPTKACGKDITVNVLHIAIISTHPQKQVLMMA